MRICRGRIYCGRICHGRIYYRRNYHGMNRHARTCHVTNLVLSLACLRKVKRDLEIKHAGSHEQHFEVEKLEPRRPIPHHFVVQQLANTL